MKVLQDMIVVMLHWGSYRDEVVRFTNHIFKQTKTPEEFVEVLLNKMTSDSFWTTASTSKVKKHGTWNPKKAKGGSRIAKKPKRNTEKVTSKSEHKKVSDIKFNAPEPKSITKKESTTVEAPPRKSKISDRISQWEGK